MFTFQLSVAQRDEEIILSEDGQVVTEEILKPVNLTATNIDSSMFSKLFQLIVNYTSKWLHHYKIAVVFKI